MEDRRQETKDRVAKHEADLVSRVCLVLLVQHNAAAVSNVILLPLYNIFALDPPCYYKFYDLQFHSLKCIMELWCVSGWRVFLAWFMLYDVSTPRVGCSSRTQGGDGGQGNEVPN